MSSVLVAIATVGLVGCRGVPLRGERAPQFQPDPPPPPPAMIAVAPPPPPVAAPTAAPPQAPVFVPVPAPAHTAPELPPPAPAAPVVSHLPALTPPVAPPAPVPDAPRVRRVTVELHGVIAGLTKTSGHPWDGLGDAVRPEDLQAASDALALAGTNPYAAAAGVAVALSGPAIKALDKPDVAGWATIVTAAGEAPAQTLLKNQGTFTPSWREACGSSTSRSTGARDCAWG